METKLGSKLHNFYGPVVSEVGKRSTEWDLNDWRWDGDLFMASPLNLVPADCRSRQPFHVGSNVSVSNGGSNNLLSVSDETMLKNERENRELEKRRRVDENEEVGPLNLKLGYQEYPITQGEADELEGKNGKKTKVSSRAVCQVEDCKADLSSAKDYHRRHKVCDVHSKSTSALVGNVLQRFCQQCSRFHVLQEFDEGKRSCRRRLAGHNRRRRKTHPDNVLSQANQNDEQGSNYLLISLLRILSNIQFNSSDQTKGQDLLSHLLKSLASTAGERDHNKLLSVSQDLQNDLPTTTGIGSTVDASNLAQKRSLTNNTAGIVQNASTSQSPIVFSTNTRNSVQENTDTIGRTKLNNIDLNTEYDGSQDCLDDHVNTFARENLGDMSPAGPLWLCKDSQQSSPPQNSGTSGSTSSQSPSTSSGDTQSRTDRIVFKLFGKDPNDFPLDLRKQILDWLSNSPTDMESYIRPGCIILTIYLRMDKSCWDRLYCDLMSSLRRLIDSSSDPFWSTGWIYARVQHRVTFMYNGQVLLDTPLPVKKHQSCRILSIKPIAVTVSEDAQFVVKGYNLSHLTSRLLCSLEGKFLIQENCADMRGADSSMEHDEIQSLSFSCFVPNIVGRGFIEVEDYVLSSSFFPFIVAEKDVCSEICTLESLIELADAANTDDKALEIRNEALDFIHEMGWMLHRAHLKVRLGETPTDVEPFSFDRLRWLIEFAIEHDWCAVVRKLLSALFDGVVDLGQENSNIQALMEIGLVHRAVRRNSKPMVEFLLTYRPNRAFAFGKAGKHKLLEEGGYLFRPDAMGPGGLTPLHIAASLDGCENVVDALTEDPGSVGMEAWKTARDSRGLTAHDYACLRGHYTYINLVQRKRSRGGKGQVVVEIGGGKYAGLEVESGRRQRQWQCRECEQKVRRHSGSSSSRVNIYRPAMVSLVAIAAVCVCTALLFKSSPEVFCSFHPFRWELLKYGSQ